jgi:hypothetical protein
MMFSYGVMILFVTYLVLFALPGIVVSAASDPDGVQSTAFLGDAMNDHRTWVISAVFWVACGIGVFWWKTRIPQDGG